MKRGLNKEKNAQMITLLGIILAVSVIILSSLASEIANIDFVVSSRESTSLIKEFNTIKENFGISLNYNLDEVIIGDGNGWTIDDESYLFGDLNQINNAFNRTKDEYFQIFLRYGIIFDAYLNNYWFSHKQFIQNKSSIFYKLKVTLSIDNGDSYITEDILYTIICNFEE